MRCLTPSECSGWLRERGITESPYACDEAGDAFCLQFEPPRKPGQLTAFTRALYHALGEFQGALLVFTDWALYQPDEMTMMDSLRRGHGEQRRLIDAPGHLFGPNQQADAIGFGYLALLFGWSAYLYLPSGAVTILFWEGDLIDVWSADGQLPYGIREVVRSFELSVTSETDAFGT